MVFLAVEPQLVPSLATTCRRPPLSWAPGARPPAKCRPSPRPAAASCQTPQQLDIAVAVRATTLKEELRQAAQLRAEAYHEVVQFGRFTSSFVKQFAQREEYNLVLRAREATQSSGPPRWSTLVAVEGQGSSQLVVGTLDIRLATAEQVEAFGVDPGGPRPAYLSNVAVRGDSRGRGIGAQLIEGAKQVAKGALGVRWIYAHAEAGNKPALRLYERSGFEAVCEQLGQGGSPHSKRLFLMRCQL